MRLFHKSCKHLECDEIIFIKTTDEYVPLNRTLQALLHGVPKRLQSILRKNLSDDHCTCLWLRGVTPVGILLDSHGIPQLWHQASVNHTQKKRNDLGKSDSFLQSRSSSAYLPPPHYHIGLGFHCCPPYFNHRTIRI